MQELRKYLLFVFLIIVPHAVFSQSALEEQVINDTNAIYKNFFSKETPIELTLEFDLKAYQRTRSSEEYHDAKLIYQFDDSSRMVHNVKLKSRGEFRKKLCVIPPFWLNIKKADLPSPELDDVKKIKVVTHCRNAERYSDYLLKEYLVYKMYNIFTPYSFRVRLIKIKYIDTGRDNKITENWAFAIEPEEMMEKRLDAKFIENDKLAMATVNSTVMDRLSMFQYMIGNGDYSVTGRHNLKIIKLYRNGPVGNIPVPYDFDFTGFVNTSYASPRENLGIENVRERYFLGPCRSDLIYQKVVDEQYELEEDIFCLLEEFEYLSQQHKSEIVMYIKDYFSSIRSPNFIDRNIKSTCK